MKSIRTVALLAWLAAFMTPAFAQTHAYSVYVDLDNNPATGCTITGAAGSVSGIEAVLTAEVAVDPPEVVGQHLAHCQSGVIGAASAVPGSYPYPVGFDQGSPGFDVIELGAPLRLFDAPTTRVDWRLTFGSEGALLGGADLTDAVLVPRLGFIPLNPTFIPATSLLALATLALALAVGTAWVVRRRPQFLSILVVGWALGLSGLAWAAMLHVLDGNIDDWAGAPVLTDPQGDATQDEPPIDIRQAFAEQQSGTVFFRIDVEETRLSTLIPPLIDTRFTIQENSPNGTVAGTVRPASTGLSSILALNLTGQAPAAAFAFDPLSTALSVANATLLDFETHSQFQLDFSATLTGVTGWALPVTASVDVEDANELPLLAPQAFTVLEHAANGTAIGTVVASDPDAGANGQLSHAITGGSGQAIFGVDANSGLLTLVDAAALSLSASPYSLDVRVSDVGSPPLSTTASMTISVVDVNDAPGFTAGGDVTVNEDSGAYDALWASALSDGDDGTQTLTFDILANDAPALFATAPSLAVDGSNGRLSFTPAPDANGVANLTVRLRDDGGTANGGVDQSATVSFQIQITAVNDAPSFIVGPDQSVNEDAGAQSVAGWATAISAGPANESGQALSFQITANSNPALFSAGPAVDPDGRLSYTPADDISGTATVTLQLADDGGTANGGADTSAPQSFTISVNAVNDPPSFTAGPDQVVLEDAGAQTVAGWATAISAGPADESGQTLSFQVTANSNPALFSSTPAVTSGGDLGYTPAANANGTATVTLQLVDDGGTANGGVDTSAPQTFTISVTPVNDAPGFTAGANQVVSEDAGAQTVAGWATAITAGPADESGQAVAFQITANSNPALFSVAPSVSPSGVLSYTSAPDANGIASLTLQLVDDGGTANGGVDTSAPQTFTVTVDAVNDAPVNTVPGALIMDEDGVLAFSGTDAISVSDVDIGTGTLDVALGVTHGALTASASGAATVTGSGTAALLVSGTLADVNASLASLGYGPDADYNGSDTLSLSSSDNGNTGAGGSQSASDTVAITLVAVNDAPVNTVPGTQQVIAGVLEFSAANGNALSVSDIDADPGDVQVDLTVLHGTLTLTAVPHPNLVITGNNSSAVTVVGQQAQINLVMEGLLYATSATGTDTLTLHTSDLGNTGAGGALFDEDTVTLLIDEAPSVVSTAPANGATVASNASLSITFSEAVDVAAGAVTLSCGGANLITGGDSGSNVTSLSPGYTGTLPEGQACTLTVLATHVTDVDTIDPPDAMATDHITSFHVDAAPTVLSTSPAGGASNLPVDTVVSVVFSEPVTVGASSFSFLCDSNSIPFGLAGGGTDTVTLTPSASLPAGTSCTVTALAAGIEDVDTFDPPNEMAASHAWSFTTDAPPSVTATTPVNGAVVNTTPSLSVSFSESVNLDAGAFTLDCGGAISTTSTPALPATAITSVSFTPDSALPEGAACTATVLAAAVHDADSQDPPDTMAANHTWSFSVDAAPSVISIAPANGASDVNPTGSIVVGFSEPVSFDTTPNAANVSFDLECPSGTPVAFGVTTASPANSVTLDPLDTAIAGQSCAFTVRAAGISDVDGIDPPVQMAADATAAFSFGAIANDDSVAVTPHLTVSTAAGALNLTANDVLGAGQITGFGFGACTGTAAGGQLDAGAANGRLTLAANGGFSYEPPAGVRNETRTFCYTVTGGDTANVAFVIQNAAAVWFIDAAAAAGGNGTQARPFQGLAAANSASAANDTIHVASSATNYAAGITLKNGVRLIGQGASGTLGAHSGVTPVAGSAFPALGGAAPTLTASNATAITLGSGNHLRGFTIGDTGASGGTDIAGTGFGTLTVDEVTLTGTGRALNLDTGSVAGSGFTATTVTASSSEGLRLTAVGGTLALGNGALSGTGSGVPVVQISAGSGNISYGGTLACSSGCTGLRVSNRSGGTITFSGATKVFNTGTSVALDLSNNTGATIQFTNGGLDIDTTTATGFNASGGGAVVVQGTGNSITSTTGTALNIANTTLGAAGLTFQSISANGAGSGIVLNNTGSAGGLSVTGDGSANSGGTIQNATAAGISLTSTRNVSLARMQIAGSGDHGILGDAVNGFDCDYCLLLNNGNSATDEGIWFTQLGGAVAITNSSFTNSAHNSVYVRNTSGTLGSLSLAGNHFMTAGNHHVLIEGVTGAPTFTSIVIDGNTFTSAQSIGVQIAANNSTVFGSVAITGNTFANNILAIEASAVHGASLGFNASGNTITSTVSGGSHGLNSNHGIPSTGALRGRIADNQIGDASVPNSGSPIGNGVRLVGNDGGTKQLLVTGNTLREIRNGRGIDVVNRNGTGRMDITVTDNNVATNAQPADYPLAGVHVQSNCVGTCNSLRADIAGNTVAVPSGGCTGDLLGVCLELVETGSSTCELLDRAPTGTASANAELIGNNALSASTAASTGCSLTLTAPVLPP